MLSPKRRAQIVFNWFMTNNTEKLESRQHDNYFENGDGEKVVRELLKIFAEKGFTSYELLPERFKRYIPAKWWTAECYQEPDPETVFGIPLF